MKSPGAPPLGGAPGIADTGDPFIEPDAHVSDSRTDAPLQAAIGIVEAALADASRRPVVHTCFDEATFTATHVVADPVTRASAVIDSVLDFDAASGRTRTTSVEAVRRHLADEELALQWVLETHAHADHLSAAPLLRSANAPLGIGAGIGEVHAAFAPVFGEAIAPPSDVPAFDRLFADGERFRVGGLDAIVLRVPGHTPACIAYVIGDAVFVGDTLFMPDYGTARCDFPGGSAAQLYRSIQRLFGLPDETRVFLCHDYKAPGRDVYAWETTIGAERAGNLHVRDGIDEASFVALRTARDATLPVPKLMLPAVQVNLRGGRLPPPEANGVAYLKLPIDAV